MSSLMASSAPSRTRAEEPLFTRAVSSAMQPMGSRAGVGTPPRHRGALTPSGSASPLRPRQEAGGACSGSAPSSPAGQQQPGSSPPRVAEDGVADLLGARLASCP